MRDGCAPEETPLRYGRLQKSTSPTSWVWTPQIWMEQKNLVPALVPSTLSGEIDLCFSLSGKPDLTVMQKDGLYTLQSLIPTVSNGRMVILCFLPQGAIDLVPSK